MKLFNAIRITYNAKKEFFVKCLGYLIIKYIKSKYLLDLYIVFKYSYTLDCLNLANPPQFAAHNNSLEQWSSRCTLVCMKIILVCKKLMMCTKFVLMCVKKN